MNPHVSFLDTFSNMFNKRDSQIQADNQRKIAGVNNILHSLGEVEIPIDHLEAQNIHIYAHNKGYYEPELQFLRAAFNILNIKHEYHEIPYPNIGYGELPLLRIEYMIFTKQHFVDVIFRLLFNGSDILEDLSNNGVLLLIKELHKVTNYYMWATDTIHYKYRNRRWLLFQPIWRTQELYGNYKKRIALAHDGIDSNIFALEKAKEILAQLEKVQTKFHGFYAGDKQNNILKSQIMDLLVYTYLQELIRNTVESDLYNLLIAKHSELKRFTEEFEKVLPTLFEQRLVAPATKVKLQKPDLTHTYQSRYRTAEEIKKQHTNSIFLSVTSVSLLFYIYFYYKG